MAGNTDVIAADAVDLELEAMRKNDGSWHPCQVYLSPNGAGLVIKYGNNGSQDILVSEKEALMRIRFRSLPLQDDDCTQIKPGEHVVVDRNSKSERHFFDAEVEKVLRVRHSKRIHCRCTFMIRWLHQDLDGGSLTVPSGSVMRLANKSINNHPTISAFIDAVLLSNSSFSGMSPQLNFVNDIDLDLHDLLEKQIEGIRNSVHGSNKRIRDETLGLEATASTNEQVKDTNISMPNVREPEIQISTGTSHLRRSNWSQEALHRAEVKNTTSLVTLIPSVEEELPDNRSPLNPLAARAALASLMSKLPQSLEISLNDEEGKGFTDEEGKALKSLNLARYSSSGINNFSTISKLSSETEAAPKPVRIVKSLFSTDSSSDMSQALRVSSTALVNQSRKGHNKAEGSDFSANVTQSRQDKMNPVIETRLPRVAVQKVKGIPDDNIERSICVDGNKSSITTNRRFTRSGLRKEGERLTIATTSVVEKDMSTGCKEYITSDHKVMADGSHTSKEKKTLFITPLPVAQIDSVLTAQRKILPKMEEKNKGNDNEGKTCTVGTKNSSNMRRLTRSMANKEAANIKTETRKESGGDEFPRNEVSELSVGTDSILDVNMLKTTRAINLPFCSDINLSPAEGRKKRVMSGGAKISEETDSKFINANVDPLPPEQRNRKRNTSGVAFATQDSKGNATSDGGCSYGSKKNSLDLKKHKVRSSPRFLPKT